MVVARFRCIRCWARTCACPRSRSATCGRLRSAPRRCRGWATTRSTMWPPFRGLPTARWRWPPLARSSARRPRSATSASSRCCCSTTRTPVGAVASVDVAGVVDFAVETDQDGEHMRRATAVLHAAEDDDQPPAHDMAALLAAHPCRVDGDELREWFDEHGIQYGPAFTGLAAAHTAEGSSRHRAGRGRRCPARSAHSRPPMACTPRCWMPASSPSRLIPTSEAAGSGGLLLPLGVRRLRAYGPTRNARYCYTRVTRPTPAGVEADLDVLGRARDGPAAVRGLQLGHRGLRERRPRSRAQRAAADHRMAAARAARGGRRRRRSLAADQHLRRCRCAGHRVDRCVETRWRAMHDAWSGRSKPTTGPTPNGCARSSVRAGSPVWSS